MADRELELRLKIQAEGQQAVNTLEQVAEAERHVGANAQQASRQTQDLNNQVNQSAGVLNTARGMLREFAIGVISAFSIKAIIDWGAHILRVNQEMEDLRTTLKSVTGSSDAATDAFGRIQDMARDTPFEVKDLTESFIKLKSFGIEPTDQVMGAITNQASKLGASSETLKGITLALGQAWAKGKLQGEEILQLVERGVPVYEILAQATGKNSAELQKMAEKGELGRAAIHQLIIKMGELADGANAEAVNTISGSVSNLSDAWTRFEDNLLDSEAENGIKRFVDTAAAGINRLADLLEMLDAKMNGASTPRMRDKLQLAEINGLYEQIEKQKRKIAAIEGNGPIGSLVDDLAGTDVNREKNRLDALYKQLSEKIEERSLTQDDVRGKAARDKTAADTALKNSLGESPAAPSSASAGNRRVSQRSEATESRAEMAGFEAGLDAYRQAFERQNALRELSKQDEKKYWDDILATYTGSSLTRAELVKKSAELDVEIIRDKAREKQALLAESIEAEQAAALDAVAAKEQAAQQEFELGLISQAQLLTQQENFEREKFDIARRYLQQKRDLIVDDKAAYERSLNEEKALLRKHAADLSAIHNKMAVDNKNAIAKWFGPIESALDGVMQGMLQGTLTTSQAMKNAWNSLVVSYIQTLAKMALRRAADWTAELIGFGAKETAKTAIQQASENTQAASFIAHTLAKVGVALTAEQAMTIATLLGVGVRGAAEEGAAKQSVLTRAWTAMKNIASYAAEAAAAVYASVAQIPYVGWILAPIAAGVTFIAVMAFGAMGFAKGGEWQVTEDGKPYILHKDETVLPAHIATPLREMVEGRRASPEQIVTEKIAAGVKPLLGAPAGTAYGIDEARVRGSRPGNGAIVTADNVLQSMQAMQAGQTRQAVTANFNVNAIDTQGVRQFFNTHGGEIVNTLNRQGRKFNFGGAK
jgi:tape measure domain-containing protein